MMRSPNTDEISEQPFSIKELNHPSRQRIGYHLFLGQHFQHLRLIPVHTRNTIEKLIAHTRQSTDNIITNIDKLTSIFQQIQFLKTLSILFKVWKIFLAPSTNLHPYQKTDLETYFHTCQSTDNIITNVDKLTSILFRQIQVLKTLSILC